MIDEAASKLGIENRSVPEEVDQIERQILNYKIELEALKKDNDKQSIERKDKISSELKDLQVKAQALREKWNFERSQIDNVKLLKSDIEQIRNDISRAERDAQYEQAAQLKYGKLPEVEKKLQELEAKLKTKDGSLLKEKVDAEDIADVVSKWTHIPVNRMLESEMQKLLHMEDALKKKVVGQDQALEVIADAVRRSRAEIADPNRPIGTFIFVGPTGVGKTETVKALADFLFDDPTAVVRIDMSEYMEKHSVSRLIGAPPGYVGYEEGGQLTEVVRRKPYAVILLDEIEKAHPDVFNVLLQLLDEGRLTDGKGRTVDFKNTVIVMTSNLGASQGSDAIQAALKQFFRPEFLNRVDDVIEFKSLNKENLAGIVKIQLQQVVERLAQKSIKAEFTDKAISYLGEKGFDPVFGARPLKRIIQTEVLNPLAKKMIAGDIKADSVVKIDYENNSIFIS